MREAFALQKLLTFFSTKTVGKFDILMFEISTLTNDIVSFEQLGPEVFIDLFCSVMEKWTKKLKCKSVLCYLSIWSKTEMKQIYCIFRDVGNLFCKFMDVYCHKIKIVLVMSS